MVFGQAVERSRTGFGGWVRFSEGCRESKQPLSTRSEDFAVCRESPVDEKHSLVVGKGWASVGYAEGG
ncbi:hypothetical protein RHMOL_Rhmol10G0236000 [Rhododendron molle]|uniref:Uncharacterized protein n=1 Tax=Rhododendron molle TaxID=49168 RepID=A0ACC0M6H0_RHOML|nr:hypothetical protein RHMOL_Rhmol10G0236000 [Rhododendron molle]